MSTQRFIISRTDSIGDVVLTLPMCGVLKKTFPGCEVIFIGRTYTRAVIQCCEHVDHFEDWDAWKEQTPQKQIDNIAHWNADAIIHVFPRKDIMWLAKRAGIPIRIATGRRLSTITKCNRLVFFTRRKSPLHEAQLNMKLLKPLGIDKEVSLAEIPGFYGFSRINPLPQELQALIDKDKTSVILHPGSKGSAVEWGLGNFAALIGLLDKDIQVFVTGTKAESESIRAAIVFGEANAVDMTGRLSLDELISFISACDVLVAASTGPLHIAAAAGIKAIGLYSPRRPIHPGRWAPLGKRAVAIEAAKHPLPKTFLDISPSKVLGEILSS